MILSGYIHKMLQMFRGNKGEIIGSMVIWSAILAFVVFPLISFIAEKYIVLAKGQEIKDSLDVTNMAAYNSLLIADASEARINFNDSEILGIYTGYLTDNMRLNPDMTPQANSIAEGRVVIEELGFYRNGYCPQGSPVRMPTIHSLVTVPVRPSLLRAVVLSLMGRDYVELKIHVDTEVPIDK